MGADEQRTQAATRIVTRRRWGERLVASRLRWLLLPAWLLYRPLVALNAWLYDHGLKQVHRLPRPVISVGNLVAGGTGKTPLVAWLARVVRASGPIPAVICRGYGHLGGPARLNDEARMLSGIVDVICDPDRVRGGMQAIADGAGCLILDDAFQHRRLHRDLDLVVIDATAPWGMPPPSSGAVLPLGLLREGRRGLGRADGVIINRCDLAGPGVVDELCRMLSRLGVPVLRASLVPSGLRDLGGSRRRGLDEILGKEVILASGLGNPAGFEQTVQRLGARVRASVRFPDHHGYRSVDRERLNAMARAAGAMVVVTAKDAVKFEALEADPDPAPVPWLILDVDLAFSADDERRLRLLVDDALCGGGAAVVVTGGGPGTG